MIRLLQHAVTEQAHRRPAAVAIVMHEERLTYAALEAAANRLAWRLRAAGVRQGDRVALLLPKSPRAIVAILATLKAGGIYVPLDTRGPVPRLARMLQSAEPRCVVAELGVAPLVVAVVHAAPGCHGVAVEWLEGAGVTAVAEAPPAAPSHADAAAYLLFTSGSTGTPKGVVITHANVLHFVAWATAYFGLGPRDRTSGHAPLHFDLSVLDIFGTLAAGGELHLVPPDVGLAPDAIPRFIREHALTQWFSVPSVLTYLVKFDAVRSDDFPTLRRLMWCGEVLPTPVLRHLMRRLPHVSFTNLYGPTEATVASSAYTVPGCPPDDAAAIPIGEACAGEELLVLDDHHRAVADGDVGDLYIAGVGLSPGYWRDADKTGAAFVRDATGRRLYRTGDLARRSGGLVYFLGRADTQIKSRGYRIELGEIEAALHQLPELQESAVVAVEDQGFEGATICCAYAVAPGATVTPVALRRALAALLPPYMLPSRWRELACLPKNGNGKIDRPGLQTAFLTAA